MPDRLSESAPADDQPPPATPAFLAGVAPMQRVLLGLLMVVLGGILLRQTLLGLLLLPAGAWLTAGRGLAELRRAAMQNSGFLLRGALSLAFLAGALWQAWFALLPTLPLFAISLLLLPSTRAPGAGSGLLPMPPALREVLVVILLGVYGRLLAMNLAERSETAWQSIAQALARYH